jgi:Domain of unknown function (DUF4372)
MTDVTFRATGGDLKSAKNDLSIFSEGCDLECKALFAQWMDFLPWSTFNRYVMRYSGDKGVRTMTCAEQFRFVTFAQLTDRESL